MRFNSTATVGFNSQDSKVPAIREGKTKSGIPYKSVTMNLSIGKNNRMSVELFGMENDPINTMDKDGNKITISLEDRLDKDVIESVANYKLNVYNVNNERKVFIAPYDMVNEIIDNMDDLKGKKLTVTGQSNPNIYKGSVTQRFELQNIYEADEDSVEKFRMNDVVYFNKDSIDAADWKSEKKLYLNGYISQYIDKNTLGTDKGANRYVPIQLVLDGSKLDLDNEKHVKLLKARLMGMGCTYDDGKIVNKLKAKKYYANAVELEYQNGAVEAEFSEDMLTDYQKMLIDLGEKKLDDFRPSGSIYGDRVTMFKIKSFDAREIGKLDFRDGYITLDDSEDEFEDLILSLSKEESLDDIMEDDEPKSKSKTKAKVEEDEDDEDLF